VNISYRALPMLGVRVRCWCPLVLKSSCEYIPISDHRLIIFDNWSSSAHSSSRCFGEALGGSWIGPTVASCSARRLSGRLAKLEVERATAARESIDLPPLPRTSEFN
jgi:hypothetical protein